LCAWSCLGAGDRGEEPGRATPDDDNAWLAHKGDSCLSRTGRRMHTGFDLRASRASALAE
jgi:hypothetical protein